MSTKTSEVDLLIIGAGPAGLMAAAWASRCGLNTRIIDEKDSRIRTGQADGLHCRTLEIMDSFGTPSIAADILGEACNPKESCEEHIERSETIRSGEEDLPGSRYPQVSLSQGSVEQAFLNFLERDDNSSRVERNLSPAKLHVDEASVEDNDAYPVEVHLRELGKDETAGSLEYTATQEPIKEIIRAKFVLGTDGAHSWTRKALGLEMEGDRTNKHFGVMDFIPRSNFPDIRISCAIHSSAGSIMTLPREKGLVRFYVQLAETFDLGDNFDRSKITPDDIINTSPKTFSHHNRVFLAGDAVHTHSPTMGAGMNVSMQDSYNLVWKIATAIHTGNREILQTYNTERLATAKELIEKDRAMSEFYCQGPSADSKKYKDFREGFRDFVSGVSVTYGPSMLVSSAGKIDEDGNEKMTNDDTGSGEIKHDKPTRRKDSQQSLPQIYSDPKLATGITLGQRLPSYHVTNHFTAEDDHIHRAMKSDGRWRILLFPGDLANPPRFRSIRDLGAKLEATSSFINRCTPSDQAIDSVIEILTIHTSNRNSLNALDLPDIFHPWNDKLGHDYWKIFAKNNEVGDDIYKSFGIDEEKGCLVVCRPDQHVGYIGSLEDLETVGQYLERILLPKR
ncbi:phenol 2-monooxygenase [Aureobasidium pullulans]|uniref:Phenol 2-monooxygenase n=1 Tax=Aureobasidium pullulans TaxID=5580 RepID=A0A4V4JQ56_AURPU|nr:phenol 2-monooxygenase [Aureobasidium pullulans]THW22738.1 phenol 2-monooxygenase [Aureobasidium pullulans]THX86790.1 phenol 2-monooxygenase [Aureobasidium pullulans]THY04893.1 phenol 2-monooxygenase [Aureobasidium pullulans]